MPTIDFKFDSGDFVRTRIGEIGVVSTLSSDYGTRRYSVQTQSSLRLYVEAELELTDDRLFPEGSTWKQSMITKDADEDEGEKKEAT